MVDKHNMVEFTNLNESKSKHKTAMVHTKWLVVKGGAKRCLHHHFQDLLHLKYGWVVNKCIDRLPVKNGKVCGFSNLILHQGSNKQR